MSDNVVVNTNKTQDINIFDVLDSLNANKELYECGIPTKILQEQILKDKQDSVSIKSNIKNTNDNDIKNPKKPFDVWGNLNSEILLIGSIDDSCFNQDNEFFNSIIKNGLKFDSNNVCFLALTSNFNESILKDNNVNFNIAKFKKILCFGCEAQSFLEESFKTKLKMSNVTKINDVCVLETYDIFSVFEDKNIKRLFWSDLQKFLKEF